MFITFGACKAPVDQQFLDTVQQNSQQADSALAAVSQLQTRLAGLSNVIQAAPEEVRNAAPQRIEELQLSAREYADKVAANLEPYQQQIAKGRELAQQYAVGKISLEEAKKQYATIQAEYQLLEEMKTEFSKTLEQYETEFKAIAQPALSKGGAAPDPEKKDKE
ncbi:MAG TPA: hypothetical protein PKL15_04650 [Saprospiraceae bacterium]|nr:hypothetical protein [Saprospiraceae bacterium]HNM24693.1 hypothetical protein [Saprospiraceae bacterium]